MNKLNMSDIYVEKYPGLPSHPSVQITLHLITPYLIEDEVGVNLWLLGMCRSLCAFLGRKLCCSPTLDMDEDDIMTLDSYTLLSLL